MAGAGYKLFNTGDVLTAAQVNTYLQEQTVMVFANSTARTTALSGVLAEGMVSYLQDTNAVEVYNGSAWVGVSGAGDVTEVQAGTGISVASGTGPIPVVTNTMATAIDAKGDLVVGTGADTFARLAVGGTNGHTLQVDSSTATGLKWAAAAGGGKVLQVVNATYSTETSNSTTSYVDTGLTATITPTANTSKILITYSIMCSKSSGNSENAIYLGLLKGASEIHNNPNIFRTATSVAQQDVVTQVYYDSPATTSATTYKVNFRNRTAASQVTVFSDSTVGTLTLMEIGA